MKPRRARIDEIATGEVQPQHRFYRSEKMGITTKVVREVVKKVVPRLVPREGRLEDGTLNGEAAREFRREQGVEQAEKVEKADRRNRTG